MTGPSADHRPQVVGRRASPLRADGWLARDRSGRGRDASVTSTCTMAVPGQGTSTRRRC